MYNLCTRYCNPRLFSVSHQVLGTATSCRTKICCIKFIASSITMLAALNRKLWPGNEPCPWTRISTSLVCIYISWTCGCLRQHVMRRPLETRENAASPKLQVSTLFQPSCPASWWPQKASASSGLGRCPGAQNRALWISIFSGTLPRAWRRHHAISWRPLPPELGGPVPLRPSHLV